MRLLQRSTRHFLVTDTGREFYAHCMAMLVEAEAALEVMKRNGGTPQGIVRMSCPTALLAYRIGDLVSRFMAECPGVQVHLEATNRRVDVLGEGFDIALRVRFPPLEDSGLVMRVLSASPQRLVASPGLLDGRKSPLAPADLADWPSLDWGPARDHLWDLEGPDGATAQVRHRPQYITDDMTALRQAALRGIGVVQLPCMVSSSSYRHQIESDIEPFRGLLMGLFFLAVGMSLDLAIVAAEWPLLLAMLLAFMAAKGAMVYGVARLFGSARQQALRRTSMFLQGGEFAFVLYAAATSRGVIDARENALFVTVVILSMTASPLLMIVTDRLLTTEASMDGVDAAGLKGRVLLIGFGRFGQIACQLLLSSGVKLSVIDKDPNRIRDAERYGFKVYFGDGARLATLHHSGAADAGAIMVCVDDRQDALAIVKLAQHAFPQARLLVRSFDRNHAVDLIRAGVDYQVRETAESAYLMGAEGLRTLGFAEVDIEEATDDIRRRDAERLSEQVQGNLMSGRDRLHLQAVPEPLRGPTASPGSASPTCPIP